MRNKLIKKLMPLCIGLLILEMIPRIYQIGDPSIAEQNKIIEQEFLMLELDKSGLFTEPDNSYTLKDRNGFSSLFLLKKYIIEEDVLVNEIITLAEKKGWKLSSKKFKKEDLMHSNITFLKSNVRLEIDFRKDKTVGVWMVYRDGFYNVGIKEKQPQKTPT